MHLYALTDGSSRRHQSCCLSSHARIRALPSRSLSMLCTQGIANTPASSTHARLQRNHVTSGFADKRRPVPFRAPLLLLGLCGCACGQAHARAKRRRRGSIQGEGNERTYMYVAPRRRRACAVGSSDAYTLNCARTFVHLLSHVCACATLKSNACRTHHVEPCVAQQRSINERATRQALRERRKHRHQTCICTHTHKHGTSFVNKRARPY